MLPEAAQSRHRDAPQDPAPEEPGPEEPGPAPDFGVTTRRSPWTSRIALGVAGAVVAAVAIVVVVTLIEHRVYAGRVLPGVEVDGVAGSGHQEVTVYDRVTRLGVALGRAPVQVRIGRQTLSASPSLLEFTADAETTARAAIDAGRTGSPLSQAAGTVLRWFRPEHVHLRVAYDDDRLEGVLDGWSAETDNGEVEGGLRFDGTRVVPIEPRAGSGMVRAKARVALVGMLASPQRSVVELPAGALEPRVDKQAVAAAAARARRLLAGNIALAVGHTTVEVTPGQLAKALGTHIAGHDLQVTLDATRLHAALGQTLSRLERLPVNAQFAVTEQNTVRVVPSRDGHEIDMNAVGAAILRGERLIAAPLQAVKPRHDTKWAQSLGIVREVSSFTTDYPPGETRVINIHRGADLLNNTIVEPGKVFSLNQTVGPRTAARGFVTAPVFAQGEFFDDYGGGVSQLATTTYNAAFFGGYKDVTHQPHTIYISRYPPGREATVNYGVIDLQFRDDTRHGILIRAYYSSTSVTVALYGDNDGRTVQEENRTQSNPVPVANQMIQCPASKLVDPNDVCATLSAGETAQVSTGDPGFDVAFDRVIDQPGAAPRREHYTWHYTMLPNQILVGSGSAAPGPGSTRP